jgi:hypothetical protein
MVSDEKLIAGLHDEAVTYLEKKAQAIKAMWIRCPITPSMGVAADELSLWERKHRTI